MTKTLPTPTDHAQKLRLLKATLRALAIRHDEPSLSDMDKLLAEASSGARSQDEAIANLDSLSGPRFVPVREILGWATPWTSAQEERARVCLEALGVKNAKTCCLKEARLHFVERACPLAFMGKDVGEPFDRERWGD